MMKLASDDRLDKGGITLWRHSSDKFSIIVYQTTEPCPYKGLDPKEYSLVEIRVISAGGPIKNFWDPKVKKVTHKKWNWFLACMNPKKDMEAVKRDLRGTEFNVASSPHKVNSYWDFKGYEDVVDKAESEASGLSKELDQVASNRYLLSNKTKYQALTLKDFGKTPGTFEDKFWVIVLYPDEATRSWIIKIDYGLVKNFGKIYPSYWELGYRFNDYYKADDFYQAKLKQQQAKDYVIDDSDATKKLLKWSLHEVMSKS